MRVKRWKVYYFMTIRYSIRNVILLWKIKTGGKQESIWKNINCSVIIWMSVIFVTLFWEKVCNIGKTNE